MLDEINKSIKILENTIEDIKTTLFDLFRCLLKNQIKNYTVGKYTLYIKEDCRISYQGHFFDYKCILIKKIQSKKIFKKEKYKNIFIVHIDLDKQENIKYNFEDAIEIEELEDIIDFFKLFNDNIGDKITYFIEHKEEMEAFNELLKNS